MDEIVVRSNEQFPLFASYVEQFPDVLPQVEYDLAAIAVVFNILNMSCYVDGLVLARDAAYRLVGLADQGGFHDVSGYFYWVYEQVSKQMASFVSQ